jgi:hypothetical protein
MDDDANGIPGGVEVMIGRFFGTAITLVVLAALLYSLFARR